MIVVRVHNRGFRKRRETLQEAMSRNHGLCRFFDARDGDLNYSFGIQITLNWLKYRKALGLQFGAPITK